jgi:putative FmdB family regulatory protein
VPIYDYVCTACGHRVEVAHGIHGHGPEACPVCGGRLRKAVVAPAVHFKGSGWAKKDRGTASSTQAAAKAAAGEAPAAGGEVGSTGAGAADAGRGPGAEAPTAEPASRPKPSSATSDGQA